MSAYLDKSQGIMFVYSNPQTLHQQAKESRLDAPFAVERPRGVLKAAEAAVEEFKPKELEPAAHRRTFPVPMGVREAEEKVLKAARPVANLQKRLGELTDAQEKLRYLLQELESLTKKKS
jgi:hypothetical protein